MRRTLLLACLLAVVLTPAATSTATPASTSTATPAASAVTGAGVRVAAARPDTPFDLRRLRSWGLAVESGACRYVAVRARITADSTVGSVEAEVDVWHGDRFVGSAILHPVGDSPRRMAGHFHYCPSMGVAVMRLGPSQVGYVDGDGNPADFIDRTDARIDIRQAVKAPVVVHRSGRTRTFDALPRYFASETTRQWTDFPTGTRVRLQRRRIGSIRWSDVGYAAVDRTGAATFTTRSARELEYRVAARPTNHRRRLRSSTFVA